MRSPRSVEHDRFYRGIITAQRNEPEATSADAISAAARQVAETLKLSAIVCYTASGSTGMRVSRERPDVPIIALTPDHRDEPPPRSGLGPALRPDR